MSTVALLLVSASILLLGALAALAASGHRRRAGWLSVASWGSWPPCFGLPLSGPSAGVPIRRLPSSRYRA